MFQTCRRIHDQEIYKKKKDKPYQNLGMPACFELKGEDIIWKRTNHLEACKMITLSSAKAKSMKNLAVIHRSQFGGKSKDVYDSYRTALSEDPNMTIEDMVDSYPPFDKVKSTFDKAGKFTIIFSIFLKCLKMIQSK